MIDALKERCRIGGFALEHIEEEFDTEDGPERVSFGWTVGRPGEPAASLHDDEDVERALLTKFEDWHPVSGLNAARKLDGLIEVELEIAFQPFAGDTPFTNIQRDLKIDSLPIVFPDRPDGVRVSIGWGSPEFMFWRTASPNVHSFDDDSVPTLKIEGVRSPFDATAVVERVGAAALFELLRATGVAARLQRHEPMGVWGPSLVHRTTALVAPVIAPEMAPLELFANGAFQTERDARFHSYYRVAEFYFERLTIDAKAIELRNEHKFEAVGDSDLRALLGMNLRIDEERAMKLAVRRVISTDDELIGILRRSRQLREYVGELELETKNKKDARSAVAKRLYEIRCGLVHAKEGRDMILPTGAANAQLAPAITLMRLVASRLLSHFSR